MNEGDEERGGGRGSLGPGSRAFDGPETRYAGFDVKSACAGNSSEVVPE